MPAARAPAYPAQEDWVGAVEAERERLAGLLEDCVIPPLNLLLSQTNVYEQTLGTEPSARLAMSVLLSLVGRTLQQVRDLQANLHPTVLQTLGLEPALEALAGQIMRAHGLQVTLFLERLCERLPPQIELALYRVAQDALDRALRWAHASQIIIRLELQDGRALFSLSDNGTATPEGAQLGSNALDAARRRIEHLGGTVEARTCPGSGLEIRVNLILGACGELTPREIEIVHLLVEGLRNKEIACRLSITPRTVNFHLNNIYSKLGVNSRTEAAVYGLHRGWIHRPGQMDR
jgi:signal transduction histidine kinase/DNA-binding CsgD family transcriptional regulator